MCDDQAKEILEKAKLRITRPRLEVLKALIKDHGPFSVEELHKRLKRKNVDLATVYRCVDVFQEAGITVAVNFRDGVARYEFHSDEHHHHHLICLCCHRSETVDKCTAGEMDADAEKKGFARVFHALELFGFCPICRVPEHAC